MNSIDTQNTSIYFDKTVPAVVENERNSESQPEMTKNDDTEKELPTHEARNDSNECRKNQLEIDKEKGSLSTLDEDVRDSEKSILPETSMTETSTFGESNDYTENLDREDSPSTGEQATETNMEKDSIDQIVDKKDGLDVHKSNKERVEELNRNVTHDSNSVENPSLTTLVVSMQDSCAKTGMAFVKDKVETFEKNDNNECEASDSAKENVENDRMKGTRNLSQDSVDDGTTTGQQVTEENSQDSLVPKDTHCSQLVESPSLASQNICDGEKVTNEIQEKSLSGSETAQNKIIEYHTTDSSSDLKKEKENSSRNVFDVFPISMPSHSKNTEPKPSQNELNESCASKEERGIETSQEQIGHDATIKNDICNPETKLPSTCKKKNTSVNSTDSEQGKDVVKYSSKEKSDSIEELKATLKNSNKNKKEKHLALIPQEKDTLHESDILKKAKEKYNLKELRISLHTDEVKDCSEATSIVGQNEKGLNVKVQKIKQINEDCVAIEKPRKENIEKVSSEEKPSKNSDRKDEKLSNTQYRKLTDNLTNSDIVKPLKKRGRRGYEDSHDKGNIVGKPETVDFITSENILTGNDEGTIHSSLHVMENDLDKSSELDNEVQQTESCHKVVDKKSKKTKKKSKKSSKGSIKKLSRTVITEKEMEISETKTDACQLGNDSESQSNDTPETSATSEESSSISNTIQLKKYPGRSCKLRSLIPHVPLKPKKSKPHVKNKVVDPESESKSIETNTSSVKIKKKRKRKVKPWSWGNEKKKYKPKPKIVVVDNGITLHDNADLNSDNTKDKQVLNDTAKECFQLDDTVILSVNQTNENTSSLNQSNIDESSKLNILTESSCFEDAKAEQSGNIVFEFSSKEKKGERRPRKKGKKGRKRKSELVNDSNILDKNGNKQVHEIAETVLNNDERDDQNFDLKTPEPNISNAKDPSGSAVVQPLISENDLNVTSVVQSLSDPEPELVNQKNTSVENFQTCDIIDNLPPEVPKRKRGRAGRSKKGEGKGKSKKRKLNDCATSAISTQAEGEIKNNDLRDSAPDDSSQNQELEVIDGAANIVEHVDNDLPIDNYPHVSPDSGIQSLAGSPAGNESPNSVIINVENSNNSSSSATESKAGNEIVSKDKECSGSIDPLSSTTIPMPILIPESEAKISETIVDSYSEVVSEEKIIEAASESEKSAKENKMGKCMTSDSSPSKKKNRAKFLQLHKTSTLLQKGRLPTEAEKEKRLDDKFDYPEKVIDKLSASPPIDLYSQHMNSFQVTHGNCEEIENSANLLDKDTKSVDTCLPKTGKKSHSNLLDEDSKSVDKSLPKTGKKSHSNLLDEDSKSKSVDTSLPKTGKKSHSNLLDEDSKSVDTSLPKTGKKPHSNLLDEDSKSVDKSLPKTGKKSHSNLLDEDAKSVDTSLPKTGKKSYSKHKGKRKNTATDKSRTSIFEKMSDFQGQVDSLLNSQITPTPVVSTSSSVISDYTPIYHSSSVLTPVTSTLTSVAMTDNITTCSSVTKPISSVMDAVRDLAELKSSALLASEVSAKNGEVLDSMPVLEPITDKTDHVETCRTNLLVNTISQNDLSGVEAIPVKKKRGRPPSKNKSLIAFKNKILMKGKKAIKSIKSPSVKNLSVVGEKRNRGRPKGSKNKNKTLKEREKDVVHSLPLQSKPNGLDELVCDGKIEVDQSRSIVNPTKNKISHLSQVKEGNTLPVPHDKVKCKKMEEDNTVKSHQFTESGRNPSFSNTMMQWRESSVLGHDKEEKKKRGPGRPRKHPVGTKKTSVKIVAKECNTTESITLESKGKDGLEHLNEIDSEYMNTGPTDDIQLPPIFKDDDMVMPDESVKQMPKIRKSKLHPMLKKGKRGRKKGFGIKKSNDQSVEVIDDEGVETEDLANLTDLQPARSVSSHDSDTSGAGSSFGSKSFHVQMWMEMSKHKRKKNKQKLRYFRSKHKNIIDPVFIAKVDCLIKDFPQLSISPPNETFLKVRPWEVPLPSIFKIVRINIKKKKKDRLFVFEKAKPLKPKNDLESGPKDKIKLGRKIGDHLMDLSVIYNQQHYNLPPKKRHKLFTGLGPDDTFSSTEVTAKPEKRKAGRPRKVRIPSPEQSASFSFGEVHKTKQGFEMGRDADETLASFASVAAQSCQSPNTSFSPEKSPPSFSHVSPRNRDTSSRLDKHHPVKPVKKPDLVNTKSVPSSSSGKVKELSETALQSESIPCDKCTELNASGNDLVYNDAKLNAPKVVSSKHLNRKVKKLKRKYRKSNKFTKVKRKVSKPSETISIEDSIDLDSSVRSVCSESEPLPTFHLDKRKFESDSDDEIVIEKRPKPFKRRISDVSQEGDSTAVRKQTGPYSQKKKYQKAGLYSDSYKDDEKREQKEVTDTYFTFDLPLHFGQHQVKNMINDFQLPFDIWWLQFNDLLPKKGDGKQYRRIKNNIYVDTRPACRYEAHPCTCKKPLDPNEKGCGEDCINRLVYTECSADMCPCYDQCCNQSIQKHQFASGLQKFSTKERGFGVKTTKPIKLGQLIVEYCGEVVSEQEFRRRMTEEYSQDRNHYCLNLDSGTVIDGYRKGNIARFVNHSCGPNCEMQKWNVDGVYHMCLFALKDIEPGEELVYDYNFQSFNHDAQQLCMCGSKDCRGIIGGKKQWFNGQGKSSEKSGKKGKHSKDKRKSKQKFDKMKDKNKKLLVPGYNQGLPNTSFPPYFSYPIKPLGKKDRIYARKHSIFLVRNFDRIRGMRHRLDQDSYKVTKENEDYIKGTHFTKRDVFIAQLTALKTSRSMKTRRLTVAEEDTEVGKMARIAGVCKEIYSAISSAKDEEGNFLATDLYHLPSKKKHPRYYQVIDEPIDLTMMQKKILSGTYQSVESFEKDMIKLFQNVELYCGKKSEMGEKIKSLRAVLTNAKREGMTQLMEISGPESQSDTQTGALSDVDLQVATPTTSISSESDISEMSDNKGELLQGEDEEEEIIRCICGIYKDEGLMIQCDKCYIWQHTDCMRVKGDISNYLCDQCDPRPVNREVELVPGVDVNPEASDDGNRYFMTLMRDDMQIRLGACVYVMKENQSRRYSYKKSGGLDKDRMDIFRIERLWKNKKGDKIAFGHMYVRPHETFHEPNRKFFPNEVFRTPLYEMFHLESITGYCCVLDLLTYCKGKPRGNKDEDLYICEYRMDKTLHLFYKISAKQRGPVNTRSYCFEMYEKRLNPKRTYSPHEVPESYKRNWREKSSGSIDDNVQDKKPVSDEEEDIPLVKVKIERRKEKRDRVNTIVDSLSKGKLSPSKKRSDLTYLLID